MSTIISLVYCFLICVFIIYIGIIIIKTVNWIICTVRLLLSEIFTIIGRKSPTKTIILQSKYDAFLSFRGEDTRKGFTNFLFKALKSKGHVIFKDDEKLMWGEHLWPQLSIAIECSRIAVVIISEDYASSRWCLDELAYIVECKEERGQIVLPIFYDLDPSDVRRQKGKFGEGFHKTAKRFKKDKKKVHEWTKALTEIADLRGWDLQNYRTQYDVIAEISGVISGLTNYEFLGSVDTSLIGIDSRIKRLQSYLDIESEDVRIVGVWGMGGIGKTTIVRELSKKIYYKFDGFCFVNDVRNKLREMNGLAEMQNQLLKHLLNESDTHLRTDDQKTILLTHGLRYKKVLIILDNVDYEKHLKWVGIVNGCIPVLGKGSRIIVTTRNKDLFKRCERDTIYEVEKLTDDEACQLLYQKAFDPKNYPHDEYIVPFKDVIKYASGLPLALQILGDFLYGREVIEWRGKVEKLKRMPETDINDQLLVSYDELQDLELKDIFLDVACFFNGSDQCRIKKILEGCGFNPHDMSILIEKSLVTIERNEVWMHNLLQQMGWHVVNQKSKGGGNRCRFWLHEEVSGVLTNNMGRNYVEGIFLSLVGGKEICLNSTSFSKMENLRLLRICTDNSLKQLEYLPSKLRVLEWHKCALQLLPESFKPTQLVELKMPHSSMTKLWSQTLKMDMLILMDLSNCPNLNETPDFSMVPNLERLILQGCGNLTTVHESIGELKHLIVVNLKGCESLEMLCPSLNLVALKVLNLSGCSKLNKFPEIAGNMGKLFELFLDGTTITELPPSMQSLCGLAFLNLKDCKKILTLPEVLRNLTSLKSLNLSGCLYVDEVLGLIGSLELQDLDISWTSLKIIPSSIQLPRTLKILSLSGCQVLPEHFPCMFSFLGSLISLDMSLCNLDDVLALDFGNLCSLQCLDLSENNFTELPESIFQLPELRELNVSKCSKLKSLPRNLPLTLRYLNASVCPILKTPSNNLTVWISDKGLHLLSRKSNENEDWTGHRHPIYQGHVDQDLLFKLIKDQIFHEEKFEVCFAYNKIPNWCHHVTCGSSITKDLSGDTWMGLAIFVVFEISKDDKVNNKRWEMKKASCQFSIDEHSLPVFDIFDVHKGGLSGVCLYIPRKEFPEHLNGRSLIKALAVSENVQVVNPKMCGIRFISRDEIDNFVDDLVQTTTEFLDMNFSPHCRKLLDGIPQLKNCIQQVMDDIGQDCNSFIQQASMKWLELRFKYLLRSIKSETKEADISMQKYDYNIYRNQYLRESKSMMLHSKHNAKCLVEMKKGPTSGRTGLRIAVKTPLIKCLSVKWKTNLEPLLKQFFKVSDDRVLIDIINSEGRVVSQLKHFDPFLPYNLCFPREQMLGWFKNQFNSSTATIELPSNLCIDDNWVGLVVCASVSVQERPTLFFQSSVESFKLLCHLRTNKYCLDPVPMIDLEDKKYSSLSNLSGFTWLTYIPRVLLQECMHDQLSYVDARIYSNCPSLTVTNCGIRLLYQRDVEKLKQEIIRCWLSYFGDNENNDADHTMLKEPKKRHVEKSKGIMGCLMSYFGTNENDDEVHMTKLKELMKDFVRDKEYKCCFPATRTLDCFPLTEILEWFTHRGSSPSVAIQLPLNGNWIGLALYAYFSDHANSSVPRNDIDQEVSYHLICRLDTERGSIEPSHEYQTTNTEIKKLHSGGFIWLSYIPRKWFLEAFQPPNDLNKLKMVMASFESRTQGLSVQSCGLSLVYQHSEEEFKQRCIRTALLIDNEEEKRVQRLWRYMF